MPFANGLYFFYFHDVSDENYIPNKIRTSPRRFVKEIEFICKNFEVIPVSQALEQLRSNLNADLKWQQPTAVVCFDDGFRSFRTTALPKLIELHCPVALFVNGAFCTQEVVAEVLLAETIQADWHQEKIAEYFPDHASNEHFSTYALSQ